MISKISQSVAARALQQTATHAQRLSAPRKAANTGLAKNLSSQANKLQRGVANGRTHVARNRTAQAALKQASSIVDRLGELSTRASDATLSDADRATFNKEAEQLSRELDHMMTHTKFNGQTVFSGASQTTQIDEAVSYQDVDAANVTSPLTGLDLSSPSQAQDALSKVETTRAALVESQLQVSSNEARIVRASTTAEVKASNLDAAADAAIGVDISEEAANIIQSQQQHSAALAVQKAHQLSLNQTFKLLDQ